MMTRGVHYSVWAGLMLTAAMLFLKHAQVKIDVGPNTRDALLSIGPMLLILDHIRTLVRYKLWDWRNLVGFLGVVTGLLVFPSTALCAEHARGTVEFAASGALMLALILATLWCRSVVWVSDP